jgi:hypothetical protein
MSILHLKGAISSLKTCRLHNVDLLLKYKTYLLILLTTKYTKTNTPKLIFTPCEFLEKVIQKNPCR